MFSVGRAELKGFHKGGVGWGLPYNKDGGCLSYLSKVKKKRFWVFVWVFSLKISTVRAFADLFSVLTRRKYYRRLCIVLQLVPLRGEKHFKPRPQNRMLVTPNLFKIINEHPPSFYMGGPQGFYNKVLRS